MKTQTATSVSLFLASEINPCDGAWLEIDSSSDVSEVYAKLAADCPAWARDVQYDAETGTCGGDFLIADCEGPFRPSSISEAIEIAEQLERFSDQYGDATPELLIAASDYTSSRDWSDIGDELEERCQGQYTVEEYAENYIDECGLLDSMPENLRCYFDVEKFARDMELGGDVSVVETCQGDYIFLPY